MNSWNVISQKINVPEGTALLDDDIELLLSVAADEREQSIIGLLIGAGVRIFDLPIS